jgi:hypothetical protein
LECQMFRHIRSFSRFSGTFCVHGFLSGFLLREPLAGHPFAFQVSRPFFVARSTFPCGLSLEPRFQGIFPNCLRDVWHLTISGFCPPFAQIVF